MIKILVALILHIINATALFAGEAEDWFASIKFYNEQGLNREVDSVYQIAHKGLLEDIDKTNLIVLDLEYAFILDSGGEYEKSQPILKDILAKIAIEQERTNDLKLYSDLKSKALYELGYNLISLGKFDTADIVCNQTIEYCIAIKDTAILIESYNLSGLISVRRSMKNRGIEQYQKAFKLIEHTDNSNLKIIIMNNIAVQLTELERTNEALQLGRNMLAYFPVESLTKVKERTQYIQLLNSAGVFFNNALLYENAADTLQIAAKIIDNNTPSGLKLLVYTNLANSFSHLAKIDSAQYYYQKALGFISTTHNVFNIANLHYLYGNFLYAKQAALSEAKTHINKAIEFYRKNPTVILSKSLHQLAEIEAKSGNYKKAYTLIQEAFDANKTYIQDRYQKNLSGFEAEFKTKEKENQIKLITVERISEKANFDKKIMVVFLCLIIIMLFVILLIINARKNKIKYQVNELNLNSEIDRRDIEAKYLLEEMNKKITERYIDGIEDGNRQLSKELHDGVCNKLFTLELQLNNKIDTDLLSDLSTVREEVRSLAHKLSIPEFKNVSFEKALELYVDKLRSTDLFEIDLFISDDFANTSLGQAVELELYRIIQESLANIIKHAAAKAVHISLSKQNQAIEVIIEDDGKGYNTTMQSKGIGIRLMQKRAESLHGSIAIESQIGRGTLIHFNFPVVEINSKPSV